jgi:tetratricopeptide (TPR) repeat protein
MRRRFRVLFVLALVPTVAHADAPTCEQESQAVNADEQTNGRDPAMGSPSSRRAKKHMSDGNAHHREGLKLSRIVGQDDAAATAFRAAIKEYEAGALIEPAGRLLYNLAQSYRAVGDYEHAIGQYRRILDGLRPREPVRKLIECHIANMVAEQERAARSAPPRDAVPTEPESPGDAAPPSTTTASEPSPESTPPVDLRVDARESAPPWYADTLGWGITTTGVVSAGLGTYFLFEARGFDDDANREDRDDVRIELRAKADSRRTWGTVVTVAGGVLVVAGAVKLAIVPKGNGRVTSVTVGVAPGGLVLGGAFW